MEASVGLIEAKGVGGLSMREVARRAGVSHQAPYHHFDDREAILAAVAEQGFTALSIALERARGPDPLASIAAGGRAYVRFALENPAHFRVMFRPELVPLEDHEVAHAAADRAYAGLEGLVEDLVAVGKVAPERAPAVVTVAWAFVHGLASLALDGPLGEKTPEGADLHARIEDAEATFAAMFAAM